MSLSRFLKYINITIGAVLLISIALLYWYAWRPLPQRDGEVEMPVSAPATVEFDEIGIPHIAAESIEDAIFLQGYVTAQDRMFQMDVSRNSAAGELARVFGAGAVAVDTRARQLQMRRIAQRRLKTLTPAERTIFAAYARGVNHYLETHQDRLPVEFALSGYEPRPWSITDSILIGLEMYRLLSESWGQDILRQQFYSQGEEDKVRTLFPVDSGGDVQPGSNAWALAGRRTESGKPILANDPHLPFSAPSIWYLTHLKAEDLDVVGATFPGLPSVLIGHNQRIAWGSTNLPADVQDLYAERLDPATGRYVSAGKLKQAVREREWVDVKNGDRVEVAHWVTEHGPVVVSEGQFNLALRWTGADDLGFRFPFHDLNLARNWDEFRAALDGFSGPAQNFVYADVDGNVGYQAAGRVPIRKKHDGATPVDGTSGEFEWEGYIPFAELPSLYNPESGLIVSANQNPFPADYPHQVGGAFAAPYRAQRIRELLGARQGWRADEMAGVQTDVYASDLHYLAGEAVKVYEARGVESESVSAAVELLRAWDGKMDGGEPAPLVAFLLFRHLRKAIAERASPGAGASYETEMSAAVVGRLVRQKPETWFDDFSPVLLRSLLDAIDEGKRMQGDDLSKWSYGRYNQLEAAHPVLSRLPLIGSYFRYPSRMMSGSPTTINQTTGLIGPSLRIVSTPGDWDRSQVVIMLGQSGHVLDSHRRDQWDSYWGGETYPLQFEQVSSENRLNVRPER